MNRKSKKPKEINISKDFFIIDENNQNPNKKTIKRHIKKEKKNSKFPSEHKIIIILVFVLISSISLNIIFYIKCKNYGIFLKIIEKSIGNLNLELKSKENRIEKINLEIKSKEKANQKLNFVLSKVESLNKGIINLKEIFGEIKSNELNKTSYSSDVSSIFYNGLLEEVQKIKKKIERPYSLNERVMKLQYLLSTKKVKNKNKIRVGRRNDGGYINLDDFNINGPKIAYSFGVENEITWDKEMADRGYEVYMYDHTITRLPFENPKFHFFKVGLCSKLTRKPNLKTLEELIQENGHQNVTNMILKIDAEGPEEDTILDVKESTLKQFDQIILELHYIKNVTNNEIFSKMVSAYEKIRKTHEVIHIHSNVGAGIGVFNGISWPIVLEVTLVLKEKYQFEDDFSFYPVDNLDYSNGGYFDNVLGFTGLLKIGENNN